MVFSHAFAGAASTYLLKSKSGIKLSKKQLNILYAVGIVAAIMPDFDIALLLLDNGISHRTLITHSATPYILGTLLFYAVARLRKNEFIHLVGLVFFTGAFSHLFLDMLVGGVAFFAPLNYTLIGSPLNFPADPVLWAEAFVTSKYMVWEAILFVLYLAVLTKDKNKVLKWLPLFFFAVANVVFLTVIFVIL